MKKIFNITCFILAGLLFIANGPVAAQDIIDEDFLETLEVNAKPLWADNQPAFNQSSVPEKYKDESAVIMGYRRMVSIDKKSRSGFLSKGERSLIFLENVRFRIRLNDRNAVRNFTEIYFRYTDKLDGFSARITKPDGTVSRVALDRAVSVEQVSAVPEFFKSFFDKEMEGAGAYYKVAIPDLNPGDIFEYVTYTHNKLNVKNSGYIEFNPQFEICNKSYPILFNEIIMETDEKSYFKSLALNGAPAFKREAAADPEFFRYVFTDKDRGVEKDVNFINSLSVYPLVKFQVIYANSDKVKGALVGNRGENKSHFTKDELARKAWEDYEQVGDQYFNSQYTVNKAVDAIWKELVSLGYKAADNDRFIEKAYYKIRNMVVNRDNYLSDKMAAYMLGSVLYQRDIKSDLLICVPTSMRSFNDVIFEQEIRYVLRVGDKYYFNCTDHSNPGELIENLLGVDAWVLNMPPGKGSTVQVRQLTLPDAAAADNSSDFLINVAFTENLSALKVKRFNTYKGISKNREIGSAMQYTPYMLSDHESYGGRSAASYMYGNQLDEYYKYTKALKDEFAKKKEKSVVDELEKEFKQKIKYTNFEITSDGRTTINPVLKYNEEFELSDMLRKAGKKILVNLPALVGSQLQIKQEERERKYDINVGYARTLNWKIRFQLPEGYTVEGLQELNSKVENEAGLFSCTTEKEDNIVILNIQKIYKQARMPKEKWAEMLAFVDAAYNNSFKYILLKPKSK